jgi:hypothetical protein
VNQARTKDYALDELRHGWGEAYEITGDDSGYHAKRRDGLGETLDAPDADGLSAAIWADYSMKPVPRDLP